MDPAAEHLTRWLVWLTNETLAASLLVGVIWLLLKSLGWSMTPGWRCGFWSILVLRLLCPWRPASRFSLYQILPHIEAEPSSLLRTGPHCHVVGIAVSQDLNCPYPKIALNRSMDAWKPSSKVPSSG